MKSISDIAINESLKISTPAWPLQNTVAVNPFWFLRHKPFQKVTAELKPILKSSFYMPFSYYKQALIEGKINVQILHKLIEECKGVHSSLPSTIEAFMISAESEMVNEDIYQTFTQFIFNKNGFDFKIVMDFGKYAAAYLDENQAISTFPWKSASFLDAWLNAQEMDRTLEMYGFLKFKNSILELKSMSAENAIAFMLEKLNIQDENGKIIYMQTLLASVLGWSSQFKYLEWQKNLGYTVSSVGMPVHVLAVRMAYDYGIFNELSKSHPSECQLWLNQYHGFKIQKENKDFKEIYLNILHQAMELSYQSEIVKSLNKSQSLKEKTPKAQILFCIDVRSEMLRRNIEIVDANIKTIGFAGFFGVPFDHQTLNEKSRSHRLPVLLAPALRIEEIPNDHSRQHQFIKAFQEVASFFRNLRKNPLSSFLYVELFGALYIEKVIRRSFFSINEKFNGKQIPRRFIKHQFIKNNAIILNNDGSFFTLFQKVDRVETVLRHMGLVNVFSKLILILGHGSDTTNNAFGSALDCGACGGHAGHVNAQFLVSLLNDPQVRNGLKEKGIVIPENTQFIAGVHETVTDEIYLYDSDLNNQDLKSEINELLKSLENASLMTRNERFNSRSYSIDPRTKVRSKNWSEVRPEWGLVGNACFIVAPRERTIGVNLNSRSFLHDYDWKLDEKQGFQTLELIMTAPMVVTNWINLQYFASTVAPGVFGSGNKVLHNLVNESGVYEGNGGDLKIGLPIQSVHDGRKFVHEPLRLSVFIEAPKEQIERIINKHEVVKELINHEWLYLIHIDSSNMICERRTPQGEYVLVS